MIRRHRRLLLSLAVVVALLAGGAWHWAGSLVPSTYSVMDMGLPDDGGAPPMHHGAVASVTDLTGPATGTPDVSVELAARKQTVRLASGERVDGYTLNGTSPGPELRVHQGDLVEVRLRNVDVPDGVTLHWHGVDLPNAEDGVAGVTQDAVLPGGTFTYRFVAKDAGTYWYHSHQAADPQVRGGLFGALVVLPREDPGHQDVVAPVHTYAGRRTVAGRTGVSSIDAPAGSQVRIRLINTDNGVLLTWVSGSAYRVLAVDGRDLNAPTDVQGTSLLVAGGGRTDLLVTAPARVDTGGGTALVVGPSGTSVAAAPQPREQLDLLTYGSPAPPLFDAAHPTRVFRYDIGRRIGLVDGKPGFWWTINGHVFPDVPMFHVMQGDVVRMTITNHSGQVHPMHLHGHHVSVLSRNGVRATGSPLLMDSLNVADGESYEIAFVADNPGIWMDHCHNLQHAQDGLIAHLAYMGVTTPYKVGGTADNRPE